MRSVVLACLFVACLLVAPLFVLRAETATSGFEPTVLGAQKAPTDKPDGMAWVPGGEFSMGMRDPTSGVCGGHDPMNDARPIHRVRVNPFWMDVTEVTNDQFGAFVRATGYVTIAERVPTTTARSLRPARCRRGR